MKILVETIGSFSLNDSFGEQYIDMNHPSVVIPTTFIDRAISRNQIRVLGKVNDEATTQEMKDTLKEAGGDVELAVASFLEMFPLDAAVEADPAPKGGKAGKTGGKGKAAKPE